MKLRCLSIVCGVLLLAGGAYAQQADVISGKWGDDGVTMLDLKYDGRGGISGMATWRGNGKERQTPIKTGTFDAKNNTFTLQGDAETPDGRKGPFTIRGTVTGDVIRGTFAVADNKGDFTFFRLNDAEKQFDYLLGDWEFTSEDEQWGKLRGYWSAVKLAEGQILDEYRVVGDKGETYYVTSTLRNYNRFKAHWELIGSELGSGLQDFGIGRKVGDEIHIEQRFGVASGKPSILRIRYYNIRPDAFSWRADRSSDGGKTWVKDHLMIEARRIGPPRTLPSLAPARNKTS